MKKITQYFICIILSSVLSSAGYAQTSAEKDSLREVKDKAVSERLQKDWSQRNSTMQNQSVQWYELGDGFYGSYNADNAKFMTLYDQDGNYVQTLRKSEWSNVPASVKSTYEISNYKSQEVTSYWEVSDEAKKGYYLEFKDDQGKVSRIWANEKGEFSTTVPKTKPKN